LVSVTWGALAAQADLELAAVRRARTAGLRAPDATAPLAGRPPAAHDQEAPATLLGRSRRVAAYGGEELRALYATLVQRGLLEPHANATAAGASSSSGYGHVGGGSGHESSPARRPSDIEYPVGMGAGAEAASGGNSAHANKSSVV
jgi:hypothetical protein